MSKTQHNHTASTPHKNNVCWVLWPGACAVQGREKDVVIFSCVRTAGVHHRSIGFVADERRINVGITRARCALLIIGHAASLAVDERWRNLVKSAVERNVMFQPTKPYNDYMQQVRPRPKPARRSVCDSAGLGRTDEFVVGFHTHKCQLCIHQLSGI